MLNQKVKLMTHNTDCRAAGATGNRAGGQHVLSVLLAMCAAIGLVAGLSVAYFTAPKAEAQNCVITNPQSFTGKVDAVGPTGTNPSHEVDLTFPQAAYVNKVTVTSSKTNLGNENFGKWQITLGGQTYTSGNGVTVSYTTNKAGPVDFVFDTPVKIGANSSGAAIITLYGQSGRASNYSVTYTGSVNDPCPPPAPTTSQQPTPATTGPTAGTSQTEPTSAEPTPDTSVPSTSAQPEPTPTSQPRPTTTTGQATTNPGSTSTTSNPATTQADEPTATTVTPPVDPNAGTGETPRDASKPRENWIGIQIYARAFDKPWENSPNNLQSQISPQTNDTRYAKGLRFRLYRSDGTTPFDASDKGPSTPINEPWATCVTNEQGTCTIYPPASVLDSGYFIIVQETEYPGSFHVPEINWGEYGNFNNRTGAQLPGFVNLHQRSDLWGTVVPMSYANNTPDNTVGKPLNSFGSSIQSLNNPPLEKARRCQASNGPKIALVMDTTASIKAAKGTDLYRDAVYRKTGNFLETLQGSGASVAFFTFADDSPSNAPNYPQPISIDSDLQGAKNAAQSALRDTGGVTNWERGLNAAKNSGYKYDEIIFVTDGDANHWGSANMGVNVDGSVRGVEAAIFRANEIKEAGTRIVSIGVGQAVTAEHWKGSGQMKAISGPTYGEDYFGTDWQHLASTLRAASSQVLCQLEVQVDKSIVDENGDKLADQSQATGWEMNLDVSNIKSDVDSYLAGGIESGNRVYPAKVSGQGGVFVPENGRISDKQRTPDSGWMVTFYGDNGTDASGRRIPNSATIAISEDTASKPGFEFVSGSGSQGSYRGSWYEVKDIVSDTTVKSGVLTGPQIDVGEQPQGRRIIVHMANRIVPEISLQKDLPNGRKKDRDQFELSISKVTGSQGSAYADSALGNAAVTQGFDNGLQKTIDGKTLQAGPFKLEANTKYLLRENASNGANLADYDTTLICKGATASPVPDDRRGGSGRVWEVSTGAAVNVNIACTFTNTPVLRSSISWKKIDNENKPLACSQWQLTRMKDENGSDIDNASGQQWVVNDNAADAKCEFQNSALQSKDDEDSSPGSFKVSDLPLGTYKVEEVRAPNGYGLNSKRSSEIVELTAANGSTGLTITDPFVNYPDTKTPGTLPRTGGFGPGVPALLATALVGLGCLIARRRAA